MPTVDKTMGLLAIGSLIGHFIKTTNNQQAFEQIEELQKFFEKHLIIFLFKHTKAFQRTSFDQVTGTTWKLVNENFAV